MNRHLQNILLHEHLLSATRPFSLARPFITGLLYDMFLRHPSNTHRPSHVQTLAKVYLGTQSSSDHVIFDIFRLYERHHRFSSATMLGQWTRSKDQMSNGCLEALLNLDPNIVFRTCLRFPYRRKLHTDPQSETDITPECMQLYDPTFILLLVGNIMLDEPPECAASWVKFFRTNAVSLLIRLLSHTDALVRRITLQLIGTLWQLVKVILCDIANCIVLTCFRLLICTKRAKFYTY